MTTPPPSPEEDKMRWRNVAQEKLDELASNAVALVLGTLGLALAGLGVLLAPGAGQPTTIVAGRLGNILSALFAFSGVCSAIDHATR